MNEITRHLHHHPHRRLASGAAVAGRRDEMNDTLYTIATVLRAIRDAAGFVLITSPLWLLLAVVAVQMGVL